MSNIQNLIPYRAGKDWTGNRNGRPKTVFNKKEYTKELLNEHKQDFAEITRMVFDYAKAGNPAYILLVVKEYGKYFMKDLIDEDKGAAHEKAMDELIQVPQEKLIRMRAILMEETDHEHEHEHQRSTQ